MPNGMTLTSQALERYYSAILGPFEDAYLKNDVGQRKQAIARLQQLGTTPDHVFQNVPVGSQQQEADGADGQADESSPTPNTQTDPFSFPSELERANLQGITPDDSDQEFLIPKCGVFIPTTTYFKYSEAYYDDSLDCDWKREYSTLMAARIVRPLTLDVYSDSPPFP
ncbi:hypothetical protein BD410DRAFT_843613 [Rickenella mellea]|uniref:Uncharacterized protein n=1 Tax=Rickenella mellea TaxID=50990 RepID=A0A4Y7PPV4_9AGAM|nr:hypothetical protein BD410DRAFT_843613 [Rickenella mellea]